MCLIQLGKKVHGMRHNISSGIQVEYSAFIKGFTIEATSARYGK